MAKTLDKSKPYATIHHGEQSDGSAFEQDGVTFDAHGKEWTGARPAAPAAVSEDDVQARIDAAVAAALKAKEDEGKGKAAKAVDKNLAG